jgi:CRP/FNR family nitrogen fixation transcriptional regulator
MYQQLAASQVGEHSARVVVPGHWGQVDALIALEQIASRRQFSSAQQIYGEGEPAGSWYRVVRGTVRICKFLADGRRHIAEFCLPGDSFGFEDFGERGFSAEAVDDVTVLSFPRTATERLIRDNAEIARHLREIMLRNLLTTHNHLLRLGRMTACERVASFLIEMADRQDAGGQIRLSMPRSDIADHLGLTVETVCRVLSDLKRRRLIALANAHQISLLDRDALEAVGDE